MIWRWLICFNCLLATGAAVTISGKISVVQNRHAKASKGALAGTVVWLSTVAGEIPVAETRRKHYEILQKNKTFEPHVLAIPVGATVDFPNLDPIFHNAFSNYDGQIFDVALYPPGTSRSVTFKRPGVVRIFCNIHSTMSAIVVVLRQPYFATTDESGAFEIKNVPAGNYQLHVYHERATEQTLKSLERTVPVADADVDLDDIAIDEAGYLAIPHLNKYGKPYDSAAEESLYPGARK